jgi:hypothetical protein
MASIPHVPRLIAASYCLAALGLGCAGQAQEAEAPPEAATEEPSPAPEPEPTSNEARAEKLAPEPPATAVEPEFKPGMSVLEAVNAIPQGAERVEIEHEVLVAPLMQTELYAPCKLRGNQRFSVKVAVWDGRVVGLDIDASPKSQSVEECLRKQIESVTWKKKVKSLSTVEFNY